MHNMPLVFFTVLAQAAAGLCVALCAMRWATPESETAFFRKGYFAALGLLLIAGVASFGHLGQPFRVLNILLGITHASPLSIEIICVVIFGGSLVLALLTTFLSKKSWLTPATLLPALTGIVLVYAISHVYNLTTVSVWYTVLTPLQFYLTALLTGFFAAWLLRPLCKKQQAVVTVGIALALGAFIIIEPLLFTFYGEAQVNALHAFIPAFPWIRFTLLALGVAGWLCFFRRGKGSRIAAYSVFALVLLSELSGRLYFYDLLNIRLL